MVEIDQKVVAEAAGKSEADWNTGSRTAGGLPPYADKEFKRLVGADQGPVEAEGEGGDQSEKADLQVHMSALIGEQPDEPTSSEEAGAVGDAEDEPADKADDNDPAGLIGRLTNLLPGD